MAAHTQSQRFTAVGGVATCIPLQTPMRGMLSRLAIKQASGASEDFAFKVYDRKGACINAVDLNTLGGQLTSVTNTGGKATLTTAAAHGLKVGDVVEVKGNAQSGYNISHTVTSVTSSTVVVTNVNYGSTGAGGWWQLAPDMPTLLPEISLVYSVANVDAGLAHVNLDINIDYENRDNQSSTSRRRTSALYLEITPEGTGDKEFDISHTVMAYIVD